MSEVQTGSKGKADQLIDQWLEIRGGKDGLDLEQLSTAYDINLAWRFERRFAHSMRRVGRQFVAG
jgi:hypothetical protein